MRFRILFVALLLFGVRSALAAFGYTSPVTINHTQVPSTQTDFPVLVSVTDARFKTVGNSGHVQNANGYDIRPYSNSNCTSALTYELERYNATTGEVVMWVKIASLSSSVDTVIYLGYGDAALNTDGSSTSTWSNSFLGVYHLKDGTTLSVNSATGSNNGTNNGATATAGKVDGAGAFASASDQYVNCGDGMNPSSITLSAWINATSLPHAFNAILVHSDGAFNVWQCHVKSNGKMYWAVARNNLGLSITIDGTGSSTLSTGTWYYATMTFSDVATTGALKGYINGSQDASGDTGSSFGLLSTPVDAGIGAWTTTPSSFSWNGGIDEARISSVARSADWVATEYNNQSAPGSFETLETETSSCAPTPTATATFTPTPTPTFTPTPSATFTPTATATFTPTPSATFTPTPTATATATASASREFSAVFTP